ncbi:MAG: FBP domain-containing protein [Naasia sp.]
MQPLTESDIRSSFANATAGEAKRVTLPGLHEVLWEQREFLGWRDSRAPHRAYIVHWQDGRAIGLLLSAAETPMKGGFAAMCSLCSTQQPANQVALFSAPRAGDAGRNGDTVGTYICSDLACSLTIRIAPPKYDMQPDPSEIVERRIATLQTRLASFTSSVLAA